MGAFINTQELIEDYIGMGYSRQEAATIVSEVIKKRREVEAVATVKYAVREARNPRDRMTLRRFGNT